MRIKEEKRTLKTMAIFIAISFLCSQFTVTTFAQMPVQPAVEAPATAEKPLAAKQALPKAGNVTVNFKNVQIKTVLHYLSEVSGVDIIPSPGVEGTVTMRLRDKPWEVALDIVTRNYDYAYARDEEKGIIRVIPKSQLNAEAPVTEVMSLNHIIREIELTRSDDGDEISVETKDETIEQLMDAINTVIDVGRGERATFIASVNSIVVTAIPARIGAVKKLVATLDKKSPQILLDAKVIEITLSDTEQYGIDWNAVVTAAGSRMPHNFPFGNTMSDDRPMGNYLPMQGLTPDALTNMHNFPSYDTTVAATNSIATNAANLYSFGTIDFSTFSATLRLLQQRGDTEVLSSPRVITLNNQKATIKVVDKMMLQKSASSTDTGAVLTVTYEDEKSAREVGVKLTVLPHVNEDEEITVNLMPEVSTPGGTDGTGFVTLPLAAGSTTSALIFSSREANTIIRVRDGETIFIGGLIRKSVGKVNNKFPVLGDLLGGIPVLGHAFKYDSEVVTRTEVVFFITVHLVRDTMDSIVSGKATSQYNKYILSEDEKSNIDTGRVKVVKKEVVVQRQAPSPAGLPRKPFLDFRKQ